jgi:hypothetical protein
MNTKLLATTFRWIARVLGIVLVGLLLLIAVGEGVPSPFSHPFVITMGLLAIILVPLGILLAWRWEFLGGIMSLAGRILFVVAETINWRHPFFFILLAVPGLLFLGSSFLRWHDEKHKSA